ncbi:MAG TPA: hypothetical protein VKZ48_02650 [Burkholderiales bacterium]|nr:hypothetical protein [Burkholderiales bacterium]
MRIVVLILLLANVALFAYLEYDAQAERDVSRAMAQQVQPERIRLMTEQEVAALQPGAAPCLEVGPLSSADLSAARDAFAAAQAALRMTERTDASSGEVYLQLRDVPGAARERVNGIAARFGGAALRVCPAPETASG